MKVRVKYISLEGSVTIKPSCEIRDDLEVGSQFEVLGALKNMVPPSNPETTKVVEFYFTIEVINSEAAEPPEELPLFTLKQVNEPAMRTS